MAAVRLFRSSRGEPPCHQQRFGRLEIQDHPHANRVAFAAWLAPAPERSSAALWIAVPAPAAKHACPAAFRPRRVGIASGRIFAIPIRASLPDLRVHVLQTPCVCLEAADGKLLWSRIASAIAGICQADIVIGHGQRQGVGTDVTQVQGFVTMNKCSGRVPTGTRPESVFAVTYRSTYQKGGYGFRKSVRIAW
jgi:hypothetical protein